MPLLFTSPPAQIGAPEGGGMPVGQVCEDYAIVLQGGAARGGATSGLRKTDAGNNVVAQARAFFFIGVDFVAPARRDTTLRVIRPSKNVEERFS